MLVKTLLTLLPFLAVISAVPAKRECHTHSNHNSIYHTHNGTHHSDSTSTVTTAVTTSTEPSVSAIIDVESDNSSSTLENLAAFETAANVRIVTSIITILTTVGGGVAASSKAAAVTAAAATTTSVKLSTTAVTPATTFVKSTSTKAAITTSQAAAATTSSAATTKVTTVAAAAATTAASTSGSAVGLGLDSTAYSKLSQFTGLDWYFNWGLTSFDVTGVEFVPCVWGSVMAGQVASTTFPTGTEYILGFNEPDMSIAVGGSDIDASTAATLHQKWTAALTADLKIGAPAVARGSTTWFNNWITACGGNCKFDFVPIHFYGTSAADLISYIQSFPAQGKPIWVTEFACMDFGTTPTTYCTAAETTAFMNTAIEWFRGDGAGLVDRWAWFGAFPSDSATNFGLENTDGSPNALATAYLAL